MNRKNKLKAQIKQEVLTYGFWNGIANPYVAEICAGAGFDWVLIDAEHSPFDNNSILNNAQAMAAFESSVIVRPPIGDAVLLKQLLDIGIQSFLIPMVESATQAKEIVSAVTYPPKGKRGVGSALARASQWKRVPDYLHKAEEEICLILQVESVEGIDNLEAICKIEEIDGVFIGPADLAASMGYLGDSSRPEVKTAIKKALKMIRAHGKCAGILALSDEGIAEYKAAGANFIGIGSDLILLAQATSALANKYKV